MDSPARQLAQTYFPAIVRTEHDSPLDALVAACVPRHEAMDLLTASWAGADRHCLIAVVDGGRPVAVLRTPAGRWVACNVYLADLCATPGQAAQRLEKLLKSTRRGYVACLAMDRAKAHAAGVLSAQPAGCRNAQLSPGQKRR